MESLIILNSIVGAFVITFLMWLFLIKRNKQISKQEQQNIENLSKSIDELADSFSKIASEIINDIEKRKSQLEGLVKEADLKISQLKEFSEDNANYSVAGITNRLEDFERKHEGVFKLHDQGLSISEISKRTNLDQGTIQLIFNLRRKV